jgi:predicted Zn-dependent protease
MKLNGSKSGSNWHGTGTEIKAGKRKNNRMNALTNADRLQVEAAEGWLMLGNPLEAHEELEKITGEAAYHPAVLSMRWQVYASAEWWEAAYVISRALCNLVPESADAWICQANTLRHYKGIMEAWQLLLGVTEKFQDEPIIRYNLACYAAQMGLIEDSCGWLVEAFELEDSSQLKLAAIYDPDLQPLWDRIGRERLFEITGTMGNQVAFTK